MSQFTLEDLRTIMRSGAGVDEDFDLEGDIADVSYAVIGYDSLAVLEIQSRIEQQIGLRLPEDAIEYMDTPGATVGYVNQLIAAGV